MKQTKTQTSIGPDRVVITKGSKIRTISMKIATPPIPNGAHKYYMSLDAPEFILSIDDKPGGTYDYECVAINKKSAQNKFKKFLKPKKD